MADRIKLLPDSVANQIAAGEVVNRPASVVKELLENAVDADSSNITVNFRDGGKALIQVVDDGCGMSAGDARLAFDRHATSKISDVEDIYALRTFGFRGEALASIASVAEVELRTRQQDDELGTKIEISGGRFVSQQAISCPVGSQFIIKNLFYNVPARRRFLDKSSTESRHIVAEYQRVALCNPSIAFTLYDSDSLLSQLEASNLRQRVVGVVGKSIAKNLLDVEANTSVVNIEGFTGRPASAKQTNREQFLFVNGRYFRSPYFHKAVVSAYEKLIPANTQPSYFLYLTIDPLRIDVNVHPQKTEVKFSDGSDIWHIINAAVRESLAKSGAVPSMDFEMDTSIEIPVFKRDGVFREPAIRANPDFNPFERYNSAQSSSSESRLSDFKDTYMDQSGQSVSYDLSKTTSQSDIEYEESLLEYIEGDQAVQGVLEVEQEASDAIIIPLGRYFVTQHEGGLLIIDRQRATEAVLYCRFRSMLGNGSSMSQQLLFPERVVFSSDDYELMREYAEDFSSLGFDLHFEGEHHIEVHAIPSDISPGSVEDSVRDMLEVLTERGGNAEHIRRDLLAAKLAQSGSRSKSASTIESLEALLQQLRYYGFPAFGPSGLPVMRTLTIEQVNKLLNQ